MAQDRENDAAWNGVDGRGGITWAQRSRMGRFAGVLDAGDRSGRRNYYMHLLHHRALEQQLAGRATYRCALDFGCGTGRFLPLLASHAKAVYGVDRSPEMIEAAHAYNGHFASGLRCSRFGPLPFADGFFDLVLSFCVLSVTDEASMQPNLREIARVCEKGATFVACEKLTESLSRPRYVELFASCGFNTVRALPIRSGTSRITGLASRAALPATLLRLLAKLELYVTERRHYAGTCGSYVEEIFVCERR